MDKSMGERLARAEASLERVTRAMKTAAGTTTATGGPSGTTDQTDVPPSTNNQVSIIPAGAQTGTQEPGAQVSQAGVPAIAPPAKQPALEVEGEEEDLDGVAILELDLRSETEDSTWQPQDHINKGKGRRDEGESTDREEENMRTSFKRKGPRIDKLSKRISKTGRQDISLIRVAVPLSPRKTLSSDKGELSRLLTGVAPRRV
ncbi:uncharacterized protein MELLADRAFT_94797 [Melampsora larici-populina 98AG31]|uniref:Uncharacterized protein n=1 Tax=Melampsora larici-populina (strain 98AG31 / pathotype 3-4-7) TaxID=747676 RepID=F4S7Y8_MELLP|nr:uncharacterized protein MELLADRAFT_94797 [Melampsora larici-populina 98AG31]EGF99190.1 hypothetical protein MELLADRAFT_94797 [Melampsora larici-populina 98AG31]